MYWPTFAFLGISIHAPSRERPSATSVTINQFRISIHAPSRERQFASSAGMVATIISIHAPSRERPLIALITPSFLTHFNPRSLTGATELLQNISINTGFQSTLPHGSDTYINFTLSSISYFNPRSLTGATSILEQELRDPKISIHAPSRERRYVGSRK